MKNLKTIFITEDKQTEPIGLDRIPNISETVIIDKYRLSGRFKVYDIATFIQGVDITYFVYLKKP